MRCGYVSILARVPPLVKYFLLAFEPPKRNAAPLTAAFDRWLYRALVLLVISCPCALVMDACYAGLLPEDKLAKVEELWAALPDRRRHKLAFVGDGLNDAPVIAGADVGIALGGLGRDAAVEAADVVLMDDAASKLAVAVRIARRTARIVRQNVALSLGVKALFVALGAFGLAGIWEAVFADVGVALLTVLNATRALGLGRGNPS